MGKKDEQLGMPFGTANNQLKKLVLFNLLQRHGENQCFQCGNEILSADTMSIEHKEPWLDVSVELFWDLSNIVFSHLSCNSGARRQTSQGSNPVGLAKLIAFNKDTNNRDEKGRNKARIS